jgi:hypothetical protein
MSQNNTNIISKTIGVLIVLLGGLSFFWFGSNQDASVVTDKPVVTIDVIDFQSCAAAGNAIMESYPRQCAHNGEVFVENIGNAQSLSNQIVVNNITPNQQVTSPLAVTGQARGTWFFEGSFPAEVQDSNGVVLGQAVGTSSQDWMTENFIPFSLTLNFTVPAGMMNGNLVLRKDNPSGEPQNDAELIIPIAF